MAFRSEVDPGRDAPEEPESLDQGHARAGSGEIENGATRKKDHY